MASSAFSGTTTTNPLTQESLLVFDQTSCDSCHRTIPNRQTRSFQYIDDLLEGVIRFLGITYEQPVNLGISKNLPSLNSRKFLKELHEALARTIQYYQVQYIHYTGGTYARTDHSDDK